MIGNFDALASVRAETCIAPAKLNFPPPVDSPFPYSSLPRVAAFLEPKSRPPDQ